MTSRSKRGSNGSIYHINLNPSGRPIPSRGEAQSNFVAIAPSLRDHSPNRALSIIRALSPQCNSLDRSMAAEMGLEVAVKAPLDDQQKIDLLGNSKTLWEKILETDRAAGHITKFGIQASIGLATLPAFGALALGGEMPERPIVQTMYSNLLDIASSAYAVKASSKEEKDRQLRLAASGSLSILSVVLLHQRFSLRQLDDGSELALPSYYSENHSGGRGNGNGSPIRTRWNVDVHTNTSTNEGTKLLHAIQVNSSSFEHRHPYSEHMPLAEGIASIVVGEDLRQPIDDRFKNLNVSEMIIRGLCFEAEQACGTTPTELLDRRTEALLDILDEQSNAQLVAY